MLEGVAALSATPSTSLLPHHRCRFPLSAPAVRARMATASSSSILLLPPSSRLPRRTSLMFQSRPLAPLSGSRSSRRRSLSPRSPSRVAVVASAQSNIFRVVQTAWKVAKDGIEAGSNLIPVYVPRPLARIGVASVAGVVALVLLQSFLSTLFFVLAMMGLIYFTFIALNTDEGPRGGGGTSSTDEDTLEEARRIMEKYK